MVLVGRRTGRSRAVSRGRCTTTVVEEALCFGWIDSQSRARVDDDRNIQWFSPRRPGGLWSASNKERIERLQRAGADDRGRPTVIDKAKADGSWSPDRSSRRSAHALPISELPSALSLRRERRTSSCPTRRRGNTCGRCTAQSAQRPAPGESPRSSGPSWISSGVAPTSRLSVGQGCRDRPVGWTNEPRPGGAASVAPGPGPDGP